jgi:hypothetical protein
MMPMMPTASGGTTRIASQIFHVMVHSDGGAVAAHHHEFPVRQVDDPHHPEDDGQPETDQHQGRDRVEEINGDDNR